MVKCGTKIKEHRSSTRVRENGHEVDFKKVEVLP